MKNIIMAFFAAVVLSGCVSNGIPDDNYGSASAYSTHRTVKGKIVSKRTVMVSGKKSGIGAIAGGLAGNILGGTIGGGSTANALGSIAGTVAGGVAGSALEKNLSKSKGYEYIVELNDGELKTVVVSDGSFSEGNKVYLILADRPVLKLAK